MSAVKEVKLEYDWLSNDRVLEIVFRKMSVVFKESRQDVWLSQGADMNSFEDCFFLVYLKSFTGLLMLRTLLRIQNKNTCLIGA